MPRRSVLLSALLLLASVVHAQPAVSQTATVAAPGVDVQRISTDPYTTPNAQHRTEVEPDTFAWGDTVVSAFQVGRYFDGGADNIGWATSTDGGRTWQHGFLPGTTPVADPPGRWERVSDPVVAYDAAHGVWMIQSLGIRPGSPPNDLVVSRSTDGLNWSRPRPEAPGEPGTFYDKNWLTCDNWEQSPFFGSCYGSWDDAIAGGRFFNDVSRDGGLTWSEPRRVDDAAGIGVQPVVQPDGTIVAPYLFGSAMRAYRSTDGGQTWEGSVEISNVRHHFPGALRELPLPSVDVDARGRIYVVWSDCRFRRGCSANDIVLSQSDVGRTWTTPVRIATVASTSNQDQVIPALAVDRSTGGPEARLALTYFAFEDANCRPGACQLDVWTTHSSSAGLGWSSPVRVNATPMRLSWVPVTTSGFMVGDYVSTSFLADGSAVAVVPIALPPDDEGLDVSMYAVTGI
ncbi:MAG TPA: sialidase family protein [Acidimicrobiales bacterium]|jgi:hypothetical protein